MTTSTLTFSSDTYVLNVVMSSAPVQVTIQNARDAYQLAVADGFVGTSAEWQAGLHGADGPQVIMLSPGAAGLAEYLALPVEDQMSGDFYLIPKA